MANHPNRSKAGKPHTGGYVIALNNGRLWKSLNASDAAIFSRLENAEKTMAGFSGRGAFAAPRILRLVTGPGEGVVKRDGYFTTEL